MVTGTKEVVVVGGANNAFDDKCKVLDEVEIVNVATRVRRSGTDMLCPS